MSKRIDTQTPVLSRPSTDDLQAWNTYWKHQGLLWRTMPEIDEERQKYLNKLMTTSLQNYPGPFSNVKLNRADIEWLIASNADGKRLDLHGANLRNGQLQCLNLHGAIFHEAHLEGADLSMAQLDGAVLAQAYLEKANLNNASLMGVNLFQAHMERATIVMARLEGSLLREARLESACLDFTHLETAILSEAHLEDASLIETHLEGADLRLAHLEGCDLSGAFVDAATSLRSIILTNIVFGPVSLAGVHWGDADLSVVDWEQVKVLGDEKKAHQDINEQKKNESTSLRIFRYKTAVRAYRQLAVMLRNQGLNEDATRFAYRGQLMQRKVFWHQKKIWQYLFSLSLGFLSGYGFKPIRGFLAYLIVITAFATAYFIVGQRIGPALSPLGAWVFSMTSFHGRGFFPGGIKLDDPLTVLAALEAFIGLLIEVTFIATLTRRLFGQ